MKNLLTVSLALLISSNTLADEKSNFINLLNSEDYKTSGVGYYSYENNGGRPIKEQKISMGSCNFRLSEIDEWTSEFTLQATLLEMYIEGKSIKTDLDYWDFEKTMEKDWGVVRYSDSFSSSNRCNYTQILTVDEENGALEFTETKDCQNGYKTKEVIGCQF